jgi:hypothetical protein
MGFSIVEEKLKTLQSPLDERDYQVKDFLTGNPIIPASLDLRHRLPIVRAQGRTNTCCAHAGCVIKEYHERKEIGEAAPLYFSPAFLYCQRSNAPAKGMYCRDMLEILRKKGICAENDFPIASHNDELFGILSEEIQKKAKPFKIERYSAISSVSEMKAALVNFGPALIAFPVYNSGVRFWKQKYLNDEHIGGHAVAVVGYDEKKGFLLRNSWGLMWGEGGYAWYSYEDWNAERHWEAWAVEDKITVNPPKSNKCADCYFVGCFTFCC